MKLTADFDFSLCGYDLSSNELAFLVTENYPGLVHGVDFWCMHYVKENSAERLTPSVIVDWKPEDVPEPSFEDIRTWESTSTGLDAFKVKQHRLETIPAISARQLWLMARQVGITKAQVLAELEYKDDDAEDVREHKDVLYIELTEPPLSGYLRDSPAAEDFREYMGITSEQFDDMWLMASRI